MEVEVFNDYLEILHTQTVHPLICDLPLAVQPIITLDNVVGKEWIFEITLGHLQKKESTEERLHDESRNFLCVQLLTPHYF